jgi:hypothetical protein
MEELRLEPLPSGGINDALAARIHDPLWFLARQWQLGEFQGDDAGSARRLDVRGTSARIAAFALGDGPWQRCDPANGPLDPLVEMAEPAADVRLRIEGGAHLLRLLSASHLERCHGAVLSSCGFEHPLDPAADGVLAMCAGDLPDAARLEPALRALVAGRESPVHVGAADQAGVVAVAQAWLEWYSHEQGSGARGAGDAWNPHRLEHGLRVASAAAGGAVLRAGEYAGESLGWSEFDVDPSAALPPFPLLPPSPVTLRATPTPVQFGGMPAPRYWELEDARFDFGNVDAAGHDLGRLLLVEFAAVYGNDWFLVPLSLDAGTLTVLDHVIVTDVFGRQFSIARAGKHEPQWNLFSHGLAAGVDESHEGHPAQNALLLPPTLGPTLDSEPLELVHLLRDEMANLAWGVERYCESPFGTPVDRHATWLANRVPPAAPPTDPALPRYIVETEVPAYWIPLVPQQLPDMRSMRLVVTPLAVPSGDTFEPAKPEGTLLRSPDGQPLWIFEEEVPRAGATVDRIWKYGRWYDGRTFLWTARRKRAGRGEGSGGLRFDVIVPE